MNRLAIDYETNRIKSHCTEVHANVLMPGDIFNSKLVDIVTSYRYITYLMVASKVERENSFVNNALLVSQIDKEIRSIVTDFDRRETHESI